MPSPAASIHPGRRRRAGRWATGLAWAAGAALLAVVFLLYTQPDFVVMMADQVWSCF